MPELAVVHFLRYPGARSFSIERLFADVRTALPSDVRCTVRVSRFLSRGLFGRLYNIVEAAWRRGAVNHITGDVHFLAFGLPKRRTLLSVMDCGNLHRLTGWRRALLKLFWFTWPLRCVRLVTTISEATRQELIQLTGVAPEKVRVVYCPVSPQFTPQPAVFNSACPRILMLGTAPNKNLERMAAALAEVHCVVELVGTPQPEHLAAFARYQVQCTPLGNVTDAQILAAYRRCDLVLFASTHEGFGLPIVEGQATGRPVVTSNCSSMAEVAGESACLVDPFDIESIRAGVLRVRDDAGYREDLLRRGFANVKRFSAAAVAEQYAKIYREIALLAANGG